MPKGRLEKEIPVGFGQKIKRGSEEDKKRIEKKQSFYKNATNAAKEAANGNEQMKADLKKADLTSLDKVRKSANKLANKKVGFEVLQKGIAEKKKQAKEKKSVDPFSGLFSGKAKSDY